MAICLVLFPSLEFLHHAVINSYAYGSDLIVHLINIEERNHTVMLVFPGGTQGLNLQQTNWLDMRAYFNFVT